MNIKFFLCLPILVLLVSCGGGSTGGSSATNIETLWESPRGTGAGLVRATSDSSNSVVLVPDINDAGKYKAFTVVQVISETLHSDGSYSGEVVIRYEDGTTGNVLGRFYGSTAAIYTSSNQGVTRYVAGGDKATNLPIGNYQYSGYAQTSYRYNGNDYEETGSFDMDVQFGAGTAQLTADTDEARYFHNNLRINSAGEITGSSGTFIVYDTDGSTELESRSIDFDGTFHGSGATHVSGAAVGGATTTDDFSVMGIVGKR